ncbi:hypothetical protein ACQ4PT_008073 [Festuca glaucescens]
MASYCCFSRSTRRPFTTDYVVPRYRVITIQDMLCLALRPEGEVVVIEGIGGLGKTWAAKAAFKTARNSNRFDTYIWVSLSKSSSLRRCIEKIATCLSIDIGEELLSSGISVMIDEHLARRKFLLVLDNAYFLEEDILRHIGIPHPREQGLGSKVIVTTRIRRAETVMQPALVITPQPLSFQASYDLIHEKIGKDIDPDLVGNCFGMPLSLILLAGALCDVPTQEELRVLIREAYAAQGPAVSVFTTMIRLVKFGYRRLPSDTAGRCLLYCLLFPDDEAIPVKDLIIFWKFDVMIQDARDSHEANCSDKEILRVLLNHGLIHFEGDDHIRMHDVIRETVSRLGRDNGYVEQPGRYFDEDIPFEYLAKLGERISLMNTIKEQLCGSPSLECFPTLMLLLRGNRHMRTISEEFFCYLGMLRVLDLSFTRIIILPQSISRLFYLRLLLLVGCGHLEKIQHIGSLEKLEVLNASGCCSLKWVECGSFDRMGFLEILDLSKTSIECLPSLSACMQLNQLLLQDCPYLKSEQTTEKNDNTCDLELTKFIKFPYGVSKKGAVRNLQLGASKDLLDWMAMIWLPSGLTFELSDRFGTRVSQDVNQTSKTYIHASHANLFQSLDKESPLWLNCFRNFHIVISPLKFDQTMDIDFRAVRTKFSSGDVHSSGFDRFLEVNCVSITNDIEGILGHAELISLKSLTETDQVWSLNTGKMTAAQELWIEECHQLENLFLVEEVHVLSRIGKLHNIWISNMENLAYFCQGIEVLTSFSCLMHLHLDCCPKLHFLFPSSLRLPNLRSLHIRFCDSLERVFDEPINAEYALPGLQSLQLWELPELSCICGGVLPSLKDLKVRGCAKLKKIPVGVTENSPFFTKIIGEARWWNDLVWDDEGIKRWMLFRNWGPLLPNFATEG